MIQRTQQSIEVQVKATSTTRTGTAYFPTLSAAVAYYRPYGYTSEDDDGMTRDNTANAVRYKIDTGLIHIGKPPTKPDERAYLVNEKPGRRYFIETLTPGDVK
jgi:hypothetical protein